LSSKETSTGAASAEAVASLVPSADFPPPPQEKARPATSTTALVVNKFSFIGLIWLSI
jgi:hypothetical protein